MKREMLFAAALSCSSSLFANVPLDFNYTRHIEEGMIEDFENRKVYYVNDFMYDLSSDPTGHKEDSYKSFLLSNSIDGESGISGLSEAYTMGAGAGGGPGRSEGFSVCFKSLADVSIGYEIVFISSCPVFADYPGAEATVVPSRASEVRVLLNDVASMGDDTYRFQLSVADSSRLGFSSFRSAGMAIDCTTPTKDATGGRCQVELSSENRDRFEVLTPIIPITSRITDANPVTNRSDYSERKREYFGRHDAEGRWLQQRYESSTPNELVDVFVNVIEDIWY